MKVVLLLFITISSLTLSLVFKTDLTAAETRVHAKDCRNITLYEEDNLVATANIDTIGNDLHGRNTIIKLNLPEGSLNEKMQISPEGLAQFIQALSNLNTCKIENPVKNIVFDLGLVSEYWSASKNRVQKHSLENFLTIKPRESLFSAELEEVIIEEHFFDDICGVISTLNMKCREDDYINVATYFSNDIYGRKWNSVSSVDNFGLSENSRVFIRMDIQKSKSN